jgi:hypothetical protein
MAKLAALRDTPSAAAGSGLDVSVVRQDRSRIPRRGLLLSALLPGGLLSMA